MSRTLRRPVEDFEAIFRAIAQAGDHLIVLVGGHAVNLWALNYQERLGEKLRPHQPLTSADMDVYATREALLAMHAQLKGRIFLSGPREVTDGTLVIGEEPNAREIDVLRSVNGIPHIEAKDTLLINVCAQDVPVLFPHLLLQGKMENALHLSQADRQDVKHVRILVLVLHEFLRDLIETTRACDEKGSLIMLQDVLLVLTSANARAMSRIYGIDFKSVMPSELLTASPLRRLADFGSRQLARALASLDP